MRILITAGPTREYFDTVRFISNASSGKMGYALAAAAMARGHEVVLLSGPVDISPPPGARLIRVTTAEEMLAAALTEFEACAVGIMAAAVADWRPVQRLDHKPPKSAGSWQIALESTPDICAALGSRKAGRVVVGYALQDQDARRGAEEKMIRKHCDAIVLNGPENLGSDRATVRLLSAGRAWSEPVEGSKAQVADAIVRMVEDLVAGGSGAPAREKSEANPHVHGTYD